MNLGFIGLGLMGSGMASNLLKKGYKVFVYDINEKQVESLKVQGALCGDSPQDVSSQSNITFLSLPTPEIVVEVINGKSGVLSGSKEGDVIVDLSTTDPNTIRSLYQISKEKGVSLLDAPVSGGVKGAKEGTLAIMVGGEEEIFKKIRPILECFGKNIFYAGEVGNGASAKLIGQYLNAVNLAAVCEGLVLGCKLGLEPQTLYEILTAGSGNSTQLQYRFKNHISQRNFEPGFSINLMLKDLRLVNKSGEDAKVLMLLGSVTKQLYELANLKGLGFKDTAALINVFEEAANIEI